MLKESSKVGKKKFEKLEEYAKESIKEYTIPNRLPSIPLRSNMVIFPHTVVPFYVGREKSLMSLEESMENYNRLLFVTSQRDITIENPKPDDLYDVGTVVKIIQIMKLPDGTYKVLVEGLERAKKVDVIEEESLFLFEIEILKVSYRKTKRLEALMRRVREYLTQYISYTRKFPQETLTALEDMSDPNRFADFVASIIPATLEEKQELLETIHPTTRLEKILEILMREIELLQIEEKIDKKVKERIEQTQKEYFLREKLRAIKEELGAQEDVEIRELKEKIEKGDFPDYVKEKAYKELDRFEKMAPYSAEATVVRTYLDWILNLPWNAKTQDRMDIKEARKILEKNHYGLEDIKERILEFLAVRKMAKNLRAPILCFVGPPGVGKTSLGKSLAEATGRKFARMSLGGLRDEAEIKGHRRTYVGAMPGRIIQLIRRVGTKNPVILLDEVDKMGVSFQGDPAAALLEVLDPEQNIEFVDHYLEVPFDLSDVLFITTANVLHTIPPALKDRMEIIEIPGYTEREKFNIAKKYIMPKLLKDHGLEASQVKITPKVLNTVIRNYTRESGVRNLERNLEKLVRKAALRIAEGEERVYVSVRNLKDFLGVPPFRGEEILEKPEVGVVTGLAWTPYGGVVIFVETALIPGKGRLILTGQMGDVMKESAKIAMSLSRRLCGKENQDVFEKNDVHVHLPEGAVPKDGPSAGVAIVTALFSAVTGKKVRNDTAMTGEITLRGKVLPVGGIKEKILAAHRSGIKRVIIPKGNEQDLIKIPNDVIEDLEIIPVESVDEVLKEAVT